MLLAPLTRAGSLYWELLSKVLRRAPVLDVLGEGETEIPLPGSRAEAGREGGREGGKESRRKGASWPEMWQEGGPRAFSKPWHF